MSARTRLVWVQDSHKWLVYNPPDGLSMDSFQAKDGSPEAKNAARKQLQDFLLSYDIELEQVNPDLFVAGRLRTAGLDG